MTNMIAGFLGALLVTYLLMRLYRLVFKSLAWNSRTTAAFVATMITCTLLGGFGFAYGGQPVFAQAFFTYILPSVIWSTYFWLKTEPLTVAQSA
jgi:hypothetical protein